MVSARWNTCQVLRELLRDDLGGSLEQHCFHAVLVGAASHVGALSIQRALQLSGGRCDVVREKELLFERHAHALDVDPRRLVWSPAQDAAELCAFQLLVAGEAEKVIPGRGHVRVRQRAQGEISPVSFRLRRRRDGRVQRLHVGEVALGGTLQGDVGLWRADLHLDAAAVKRGERILQPDPELTDHELGLPALLGILVLGQVLVVKAAAEVGDVPPVATLDDARLGRAAECLLVERVGDHFADRLGHAPVVEDLLDVEVEERRFFLGRQGPTAR